MPTLKGELPPPRCGAVPTLLCPRLPETKTEVGRKGNALDGRKGSR
jgi:hypothetical protein